jgi:hypothetical protein
VTREKDANSRFASRCENLNDFIRDLLPILDLLHDSDLHVVHDQKPIVSNHKFLPAFAEYLARTLVAR